MKTQVRNAIFLGLALMTASSTFARRNGYWGRNSGGGGRSDSSSSSSPSSGHDSSRHGGNDVNRGTSAWIVHESLEHSMRRFASTDPQQVNSVTAANVNYDANAQRSTVTILTAAGAQTNYQCTVFDDSSRSGTIIKKEVACNRVP